MKASIVYRVTAVLLLIFAAAHGFGFTQHDPKWGADILVASMQSLHFRVQGFDRTYWDFYLAGGYSTDVFVLFSAVLSWQLGGLPPETLKRLWAITWLFALCYAGITAVACAYLFIPPIIFSAVITLCLSLGAWRARRPVEAAAKYRT